VFICDVPEVKVSPVLVAKSIEPVNVTVLDPKFMARVFEFDDANVAAFTLYPLVLNVP
jgi:hypothetical protein